MHASISFVIDDPWWPAATEVWPELTCQWQRTHWSQLHPRLHHC